MRKSKGKESVEDEKTGRKGTRGGAVIVSIDMARGKQIYIFTTSSQIRHGQVCNHGNGVPWRQITDKCRE